jgi:hypothetical protein
MKKLTPKTLRQRSGTHLTEPQLSTIVGGYLAGAEGGDPRTAYPPCTYQPAPPPR